MIQRNQMGPKVLHGAIWEAERAMLVAVRLQGLRNAISDSLHPHLDGLISEMQITARQLRDVADKSQVCLYRVPEVIDYLNIVLPCLSLTLRDITAYIEDTSRRKESRWRLMYHKMSDELVGTTLPARFVMYNQFLTSLLLLLSRSPNFDLNALDALRNRILQLRDARNIAPPTPVTRMQLIRRGDIASWAQLHDAHWAESIFTTPTATRHPFKRLLHLHDESKAFGPLDLFGHLTPMKSNPRILAKTSFDNDRLSIMFFLLGQDDAPFVFVRTCENNIEPWAAYLGVHELVIKRERECYNTLKLTSWSVWESRSKPWARLQFKTWEELVLFQCTFVALKAKSYRTINVHPDEYEVQGENRLFQAKILDDNYYHSLVIYEDRATKGWRLHAAVWEGEMSMCPVWTAFIKPHSDVIKKSRHQVWLRNLQPFVFSDQYRARHQRRGRLGAFEIYFVNSKAASSFFNLLAPPSPPEHAPIIGTDLSDNAGDSGVD